MWGLIIKLFEVPPLAKIRQKDKKKSGIQSCSSFLPYIAALFKPFSGQECVFR